MWIRAGEKLLMLWNWTQENLLSPYGRVTSMAWLEKLLSTFFSSPASTVDEWNGSNFQTIRLGENVRKLTASIKMEQSLVCWNFGLHIHFCNHFVYSWAIQYFSQCCGYNTRQMGCDKGVVPTLSEHITQAPACHILLLSTTV